MKKTLFLPRLENLIVISSFWIRYYGKIQTFGFRYLAYTRKVPIGIKSREHGEKERV